MEEERLNSNKERFLTILKEACECREGSNFDKLEAKLSNSDFFVAPASTKYHSSYEGGLCQHCLNVYDNLVMLVEQKGLNETIAPESIAICALLHDMSKMNCYKKDYRNVKVRHQNGKQHDAGGNFDWVAEEIYVTIPDDERKFTYGNHEETSEFMIRAFIPLKVEESLAVLNHHGGIGYDSIRDGFASKVMARSELTTLLHAADILATFIDEKKEDE